MAIISFDYNFIFIKTTKTAGTSIEVDLSAVVEPGAIVTPISPAVAGHHPRNYARPRPGAARFYNHMTAVEIRESVGVELFDGMHKFCVEREPITKCISHFHMLRNSPEHNPEGAYRSSWQQFCDDGSFPIDIDKYSEVVDGRRVLLVNRVLRYERLAMDLPDLLARLGLPQFELVSRAKSGYSANRLISREDVSVAQAAVIQAAFAETGALTGLY